MAIRTWLGVSHRVVGLMSYWIITENGTVISITKVQHLTIIEKERDQIKDIVREFDREMILCFNEEEDLNYDGSKSNPEDWSEYLEQDSDFWQDFYNIVNDSNVPEADANFILDLFDRTYLKVEL